MKNIKLLSASLLALLVVACGESPAPMALAPEVKSVPAVKDEAVKPTVDAAVKSDGAGVPEVATPTTATPEVAPATEVAPIAPTEVPAPEVAPTEPVVAP